MECSSTDGFDTSTFEECILVIYLGGITVYARCSCVGLEAPGYNFDSKTPWVWVCEFHITFKKYQYCLN